MATTTLIIIAAVLGAVAAAALLARVTGGSPPIRRAIDSDDVTPVVEWIDRLTAARQPDAFNRAIRQLWDDYQRELATRLIRELATRHAETRIAQYWLDQAQRVEPDIARRTLDRAFLERHFHPEVAARCGQFG